MHNRGRIVALVALVAVALTPAPAFAAADASSPNEAARIATTTADRVDAIETSDTGATAGRPLLSSPGPGRVSAVLAGQSLELTVPHSDQGALVKATGNTLVATGSTFDTVMEPIEGGVRAITVINRRSAPDTYEYGLANAEFRQLDSGAIVVARGNQILGFVAPPWAVDATGKAVGISYAVTSDGKLRQTVNHSDAVYPVVADPSVSFGWYVYVRYSKSEVQTINYWISYAGNAVALAIACGMIPVPWVAAACGAIGAAYLGSIMGTLRDAKNANQCFELRFTYNGIVVGWRRYNC